MTVRNTPRPPVTALQQAILERVWSTGQATADDVRTALLSTHPLKDSSVRTMLRRLETHGYLRHRVEGKTFVYEATLPPQRIAASAVRQIIDRFCSGSVEQFLVGLVDEQVLSSTQLAQVTDPAAPRVRRKQQKALKKQKKRDKQRKKSR